MPSVWAGASSYFLHTLATRDRTSVLDAMAAANLKTVRIFLSYTYAGNKGTSAQQTNDLEPNQLGTYDDTILQRVDQLMVECQARGMKLMIALHDRYALGFWSTDRYATTFGIAPNQGAGAAQKISDASAFYTNPQAVKYFDQRIQHVLSHRNMLMGGKTWSQLDSVIYAFEPENEPSSYMDTFFGNWVCARAKTIKAALPTGSGILVSTGGGATLSQSVGSWAMGCSAFDVVPIHSYDPNDIVSNVGKYVSVAKAAGKTLIVGEWGQTGSAQQKASTISWVGSTLKKLGIPQMIWEIVTPGSSDFETWTDQSAAWQAIKAAASR